jgi:catalase
VKGYIGHTHEPIKPDGSFVYVQNICKTSQGNKTMTNAEAANMALGNIGLAHAGPLRGNAALGTRAGLSSCRFWTPRQAERLQWNIFNLTKV